MTKTTIETMKFKKIKLSTILSDLYGKDDYQSYIEVGKEYWYWFSESDTIWFATHKHWNKIIVTYIRSGVMFYKFPDVPDMPEDYCPLGCYMTSRFEEAELDPIKEKIFDDIEKAKKLYYFDDERTMILNWPQEKVVEVDPNEDNILYVTLMVLNDHYYGSNR